MHFFRRTGEAAGIGNRDECLQLVEIKGSFHRRTYHHD
jgi:hypothetical protein